MCRAVLRSALCVLFVVVVASLLILFLLPKLYLLPSAFLVVLRLWSMSGVWCC